MDFTDDDQSTISMPVYTPRSSYDTEYSNAAKSRSRFLQLGPEMIQLSSALRDRLSPGDPMIAAWDDLICTLQKGCETPKPRAAEATTTRVLDTEKHATKDNPDHKPSHMAEGNAVWRLCDYPSNINGPSEFGHEGVQTGVKRSYCESVASDANFPGSFTEVHPSDGADGPEKCAIENDFHTSNDKSVCDACDQRGDPRDTKSSADHGPWSYTELRWSTATPSVPESCTATAPIAWGIVPRRSPSMSESRHSSPTQNTRQSTSVPAADPPKHSNYSVTYWATIKYGEQAIQVPIDSDHVSGPEKRVIEGDQGMQMVWDWVVKKGLNKWIGLQDAFDLAMDMRDDPPTGFFYDTEGDMNYDIPVKSESGSHRSRRGPLSAKKARLSPTPSDHYSLSVASDILSR